MTFRDYMEQVERDAREVIEEEAGWYSTWEVMHDALFVDDAVTGNGSGSYTFNAFKAAENARDLIFDDDFIAEASMAGYGIELFAESPETVDVVARCLAHGLVSSSLKKAYGSARAEIVAWPRKGVPFRIEAPHRRRGGHRARPGDLSCQLNLRVCAAPTAEACTECRADGAVLRARKRALRPVGRCGGSTVRLLRALPLASRVRKAQWLAFRMRFAHATRTPRTAAFDGSTVRHHSAVSHAAGSRSSSVRWLHVFAITVHPLTSPMQRTVLARYGFVRTTVVPPVPQTNHLAPLLPSRGRSVPLATARSRP